MTSAQVAEARVTAKHRVDSRHCEHLKLKLERSSTGDFTGNFHCTVCGESVAKKL